MDKARKLELLDQQVAAANDGAPTDFSLWRETSDVVLRNVLGDANPREFGPWVDLTNGAAGTWPCCARGQIAFGRCADDQNLVGMDALKGGLS